jgi:hypothetical protein
MRLSPPGQKNLQAPRAKTAARGYGRAHQLLRARWAPRVAAGGVDCWRCGQPIRADEDWHLGHDDHDRTIYRGPEHVGCNCATEGRREQPPAPPARRSRDW